MSGAHSHQAEPTTTRRKRRPRGGGDGNCSGADGHEGTGRPLFAGRRKQRTQAKTKEKVEKQPGKEKSFKNQSAAGDWRARHHRSLADDFGLGSSTSDAPFTIPHCIARYTSQVPKQNVQDQVIPIAGHSVNEPGIAAGLVAANEKLKNIVKNRG
ncbi:hypothetical protein NL676_017961 [Syzygium grande]|nr:hypothetical protein NL676_017961 [Syzygium grande]